MHEERFDVAVVGYGPTGLVLASLLGQMGHRVVVVERWPTLYGLPRLTHIDGETARVLSFACDIDYALRDSSPLTSYLFLDANGRTLVDSSARPEPSMGFPAHISIHQPDIEDAMDKQIRQLTNVTLKQGVTLAGVRLELNEAYLTVRTQDKNETLRAKFVFGADGARSQVRSSLGIGLEDFGFNERWLNVDSERKRDLPAKFNRTTQFCDPRRGYMFMPIGKTRQRFEFALLRNEDMDTMQSPSTAWRLLGQYHGISSDDISIIRQIVYTFECRLAETWRQGVALLGGDAAHTMPPYLGQGACSGIRDAANIAWKLNLVLTGRASVDLLDTYEAERRPHVTSLMKTAVKLGKVANTHSRLVAALRNVAFRLKLVPPPPPFPSLSAGVIERGRQGPAGLQIGRVPPQSQVRVNGRLGRLDDYVGYNFALISVTNPHNILSQVETSFLENLGCRILTLSDDADANVARIEEAGGSYLDYLRSHGAVAMLTRPDTYLFGFASEPTDLSRLVNELKDRLCWRSEAQSIAA